jgi:outer membrane receptor for ferrienterochelin and colicin
MWVINPYVCALFSYKSGDKAVIGVKTYRAMIVSICLVLSLLVHVRAQNDDVWHVNFENEDLSDAITKLSLLSETNIIFSPDQIGDRTVTLSLTASTGEILLKLLSETGMGFKKRNGQYILYVPRRKLARYFISGYVEDDETGERLTSAHVLETESGIGTSTNEYGYFSLKVPGQTAQLHVSYLGYVTDTTEVSIGEQVISIRMRKLLTLEEVVIYSDRKDPYHIVSLDGEKIIPDRLESAAGLGGEFDLHQYATQLPGVTTGADGIGGINIRGGNNDQNLVLMDGVPIYNPTHAIGVLSVFNPNIINDAQLTTGSFPARYAGRLSSVMDVHTKEGSNRKWGFTGGIGTLSANALIEGPLVKDKVSLLVSGRIFVPQAFLRKLSVRDKEANGLNGYTNYTFNDLNVKLSAVLSSRDRIYLSYYRGKDRYQDITERLTYYDDSQLFESFDKSLEWGNSVGILRWNHELGERTFSNLTLTSSRFSLQSRDVINFKQTLLDPQLVLTGFVNREFKSNIEDLAVKWDVDHMIGANHRMRFGVSLTRHYFKPKSIAFDDQAQIQDFVVDEGTIDDALFAQLFVKAGEYGLYVEDDIQITPKLTANAGLRISAFGIKDKTYFNSEPRLKLAYQFSDKLSVEVAASRMVQYIHLLTSSGIGFPTDLWVPSSKSIKPQIADQVSAGAVWQPGSHISFGWQVYYKRMQNLTQYREGASFLLKEGAVEAGIIDAANWEDKVVQGDGVAYGSEWQAKVNFSKWSASVNYTLSKSERTFDELNFGESFPFKFDRRHNVSTTGSYHFNKVLTASANWTYGSGAPITLAESKFLYPGSGVFLPLAILEFGERNGYRLPAYHRLDLGVSATWQRPKIEHKLSISIYNVYGRRNLLYVTVVRDSEAQVFENRQFSVLPFIPSLSYQIRL